MASLWNIRPATLVIFLLARYTVDGKYVELAYPEAHMEYLQDLSRNISKHVENGIYYFALKSTNTNKILIVLHLLRASLT